MALHPDIEKKWRDCQKQAEQLAVDSEALVTKLGDLIIEVESQDDEIASDAIPTETLEADSVVNHVEDLRITAASAAARIRRVSDQPAVAQAAALRVRR